MQLKKQEIKELVDYPILYFFTRSTFKTWNTMYQIDMHVFFI